MLQYFGLRAPLLGSMLLLLSCSLCGFKGVKSRAEDPVARATIGIDPDLEMRIDSQVYRVESNKDEVLGQSLTLFSQGVAYDMLLPDFEQISVFDSARGRILLLNERQSTRCELTLQDLEKFTQQLRKWTAAKTNDKLLQFCAQPKFEVAYEQEAGELSLKHPLLEYRVETAAAASAASSQACRTCWDQSAQVNAILRPGSIPPFVRMALNQELDQRQLTPRRVELTLRSGLGVLSKQTVFHSTHEINYRLLESDRRKIARIQQKLADFELVSLERFRQEIVLTAATAKEPSDER